MVVVLECCNGEDLISVWTDFLFASQYNLMLVYRANVNKCNWPVRFSFGDFQGDVLLRRKPQIEYKPKQPRWSVTKKYFFIPNLVEIETVRYRKDHSAKRYHFILSQ